MTQVCQHGDHNAIHWLQNGGRLDGLILYKGFQSFRELLCFSWVFLQLSSKIQFLICCDTERCWLCREFYRASLQHYLLCSFLNFFTDTWEDDNFCFWHRDFRMPLSNPFCDFRAIFLEIRKSFFHRDTFWNMCGVISVLFTFTFAFLEIVCSL